jgi:hypothetical protein
MNAEIRALYSPDVHDLESWQPPRPDSFGILLQLLAGPAGEEGEESFDLLLCTTRWIEETHSPEDIVVGRHHLIVKQYRYDAIADFIRSYVASCSGDTWEEVAEKLGRLGKWEFEDYREAP